MQPLVSIIIPCYNHEKFINDCVESILRQNYDNIELIVSDDCSSDNSFDLFASNRNRLEQKCVNTIIKQNETNLGLTGNINSMLDMVNGKYVKLIASDDIMFPNAIAEFVEYMERNPEVGVVVSNGVRILEESSVDDIRKIEVIYTEAPRIDSNISFEMLYMGNYFFAPGAFVRADIYDKYGKYDESIAIEDWEYWLRLVSLGYNGFAYIDKQLVGYRMNSESFSAVTGKNFEQRRIRMFAAEMQIIEKYRQNAGNKLYSHKKYNRITVEMDMARQHDLKGMYKFLSDEMSDRKMFSEISLKEKLGFMRRGIWLHFNR